MGRKAVKWSNSECEYDCILFVYTHIVWTYFYIVLSKSQHCSLKASKKRKIKFSFHFTFFVLPSYLIVDCSNNLGYCLRTFFISVRWEMVRENFLVLIHFGYFYWRLIDDWDLLGMWKLFFWSIKSEIIFFACFTLFATSFISLT